MCSKGSLTVVMSWHRCPFDRLSTCYWNCRTQYIEVQVTGDSLPPPQRLSSWNTVLVVNLLLLPQVVARIVNQIQKDQIRVVLESASKIDYADSESIRPFLAVPPDLDLDFRFSPDLGCEICGKIWFSQYLLDPKKKLTRGFLVICIFF